MYISNSPEQNYSDLVSEYRGLALSIARRMGMRDDDVEQVAMLGLVKAAQRFDPGFNNQFSTFAWRTIEGEIKRYYRDTSWSIHVSRGLQDRSVRIKSCIDDLTNESRRAPTVIEIAHRAQCTEEEVVEALELLRNGKPRSLDQSSIDDDATSYIELGETDAAFEAADDQALLRDLMRELPQRQQMVIKLRFYDQLSQVEIGRRLGLSQMHVSRLLAKSLATMRNVATEMDAGLLAQSNC